jgi:hypothetical protein
VSGGPEFGAVLQGCNTSPWNNWATPDIDGDLIGRCVASGGCVARWRNNYSMFGTVWSFTVHVAGGIHGSLSSFAPMNPRYYSTVFAHVMILTINVSSFAPTNPKYYSTVFVHVMILTINVSSFAPTNPRSHLGNVSRLPVIQHILGGECESLWGYTWVWKAVQVTGWTPPFLLNLCYMPWCPLIFILEASITFSPVPSASSSFP